MNVLPYQRPTLRALNRGITSELAPAFRRYVDAQYRSFLLAVNFIALLAYNLYVVADALVIPDVATESLLIRGSLTIVGLVNIYLVFQRFRSVFAMDILMPLHDIVATIAWFEILKLSSSDNVTTFAYASVVFILLANLGVRYSFRGVLACTSAIVCITLYNVWLLNERQAQALMIFSLIYLPLVLFSLFISWTNTRGVRRAFLDDYEKQRQRDELAELNQRLATQANTDALTEIGNRRAFDLKLAQYWQHLQENGRLFSLLVIDIDYFKPFNDNYGHHLGDRSLCQVAHCIRQNLRHGQGEIFRYGGEEFVVLLQISEPDELVALAERLRVAIFNLRIEHHHRNDELGHLTVSIGGCTSQVEGIEHGHEFFAHCDHLLYQAKQQGRNCICTEQNATV